jgi:hypothetical protein
MIVLVVGGTLAIMHQPVFYYSCYGANEPDSLAVCMSLVSLAENRKQTDSGGE